MSLLVDNERTKLLANALDRASTACLTVGLLAPLAALLYNLSARKVDLWIIVGGGLLWFLVAIALHLVARWILRSLA
jgi:hypothetical protein